MSTLPNTGIHPTRSAPDGGGVPNTYLSLSMECNSVARG